jgi:5-methylcytosine-specific restriction endonuclease McrA
MLVIPPQLALYMSVAPEEKITCALSLYSNTAHILFYTEEPPQLQRDSMPYKDRDAKNEYERGRRKLKRANAALVRFQTPREGAREKMVASLVSKIMGTVKNLARHRYKQYIFRRDNPTGVKRRNSIHNKRRKETCDRLALQQRELAVQRRDERGPLHCPADYRKAYMAKNIQFKIRCRLSSRLGHALKSTEKHFVGGTTEQFLGCSFSQLKDHLLLTANVTSLEGMHVDHIFPISKYNLPEEAKKAMHWSNTRLVTAFENQQKGNSLPSLELAMTVNRDRWPAHIKEEDLASSSQ